VILLLEFFLLLDAGLEKEQLSELFVILIFILKVGLQPFSHLIFIVSKIYNVNLRVKALLFLVLTSIAFSLDFMG